MSAVHEIQVTFQDPSEDKTKVKFDLVKLFIAVGSTVREKDVLAEIESDKGVVDIESPVSGKILEIRLEVGQTYFYADVLCTVEET